MISPVVAPARQDTVQYMYVICLVYKRLLQEGCLLHRAHT
jgi:hypothetical protein